MPSKLASATLMQRCEVGLYVLKNHVYRYVLAGTGGVGFVKVRLSDLKCHVSEYIGNGAFRRDCLRAFNGEVDIKSGPSGSFGTKIMRQAQSNLCEAATKTMSIGLGRKEADEINEYLTGAAFCAEIIELKSCSTIITPTKKTSAQPQQIKVKFSEDFYWALLSEKDQPKLPKLTLAQKEKLLEMTSIAVDTKKVVVAEADEMTDSTSDEMMSSEEEDDDDDDDDEDDEDDNDDDENEEDEDDEMEG